MHIQHCIIQVALGIGEFAVDGPCPCDVGNVRAPFLLIRKPSFLFFVLEGYALHLHPQEPFDHPYPHVSLFMKRFCCSKISPQDIIVPRVMDAEGILFLLVHIHTSNKSKPLTDPPATTGTKALVSHPLALNLYSRKDVKSFSMVKFCLIESVNALAAACPSRRIWTTSFSLLNTFISLSIGRKGLTLR